MHDTLPISVRRITWVLGSLAVALALCSIGGKYLLSAWDRAPEAVEVLADAFDVNAERSVPTWYGASLLLACGLLLGVTAVLKMQMRQPFRHHWLVLALIFVGLSVDEIAGFHEKLNAPLLRRVGDIPWLHFAWVIAGAAFVAVFFIAFFRFWRHLPLPDRRLFALAAVVFLAGALGFEIFGASEFAYHGSTMRYWWLSTFEELLEMLGAVTFLSAQLHYLTRFQPEVTFRVTSD